MSSEAWPRRVTVLAVLALVGIVAVEWVACGPVRSNLPTQHSRLILDAEGVLVQQRHEAAGSGVVGGR